MMEEKKGEQPLRVLVAASGTGGHILPAVYIADALQATAPGTEVLFIGSGRPLEEKLVEGNGYRREVVSLTGLKRLGVKGAFAFLFNLPGAILQTWRLLSTYRPSVIIGVGGYVSVLPIVLGRLRGIPTWIHEAEHKAGLANWLLAFFADKISTAWPNTEIPCARKAVTTGHPVRPALLQTDFARTAPNEPPRLLILGGSQGARSLDLGARDLAAWLAERRVSVRHQCRAENQELLLESYQAAGVDAQVVTFIEDMAEALQWSDLVLSRAGAGAVRELDIAGRPCVLVPLPGSQEQRDNAHVLLERGQSIVVSEGQGFSAQLRASLEKLLVPEYYQYFNRSGKQRESAEASREIADGCLKLLQKAAQA